ncbi:BglII/BstYI family type II restriction endonuclease [Thioclava sp. IC9]|uniref:BglII/BstYI family type II restriction endonuclease n=1 Tax=Thioclava sp. IC9 TaxID=1973007 RepID=UPI0014137036|nr:BglII/BstYI family type II restriction endonuclease [Thioclava sp. IC9]
METHQYSHLGGSDALPKAELDEILAAISRCKIPIERGVGPELRNDILDGLKEQGWTDKVQVAHGSKISIASQKNRVGLGIQTAGNMSRMYADLIKLQQMYLDGLIDVGALILPTAVAARTLGDNLANSDRLEGELAIFRKVIHIPLVIFSFQ